MGSSICSYLFDIYWNWSSSVQMLMGHYCMTMLVIVAVLTVDMDMGMGVGVGMLMGMDSIAMGMFVGMGMIMLMGMLQFDSVFNHKICADNHHNQGKVELDCRPFA